MRIAPSFLALVVLAACAPSAGELRLQRVQHARSEAGDRPGHRQAQDLADAIHTAYQAGDYAQDSAALQRDVDNAIAVIDRAIAQPTIDTPTLVAWKGLLMIDAKRYADGFVTLSDSFQMAPNLLAGQNLIAIYGAANRTDEVAATCQETLAAVAETASRMDLVALCRRHMNAATPEGELAWMRPDQAAWYEAESARAQEAEVEQEERARLERSVVRQVEQCSLSCKQTGLRCQNRCSGDTTCENRCVESNHACVDQCASVAYEQLDVDPEDTQTR